MLRPRTFRAALRVLKQSVAFTKKYGPLIPPAIKGARHALRESKKTWHEFREFRKRTPQPVGRQPACVDCVRTIIDDLVARERWCIGRLGELCLRCHRRVDAFGRALE